MHFLSDIVLARQSTPLPANSYATTKMPPFLPIFVKVIELPWKGWLFLARGPQMSPYLADGTRHSGCA